MLAVETCLTDPLLPCVHCWEIVGSKTPEVSAVAGILTAISRITQETLTNLSALQFALLSHLTLN